MTGKGKARGQGPVDCAGKRVSRARTRYVVVVHVFQRDYSDDARDTGTTVQVSKKNLGAECLLARLTCYTQPSEDEDTAQRDFVE